MELEEQDSFIAIWWPTGKRTHSKMFIDSSKRFVPSKLIYTLSGIQSHPNSIPITKRSWTTKHRSASSASSIVRWLIDSLAMDWLRSRTIKSPSSLTYWSNVQSINTSSRKPATSKIKWKSLFYFKKCQFPFTFNALFFMPFSICIINQIPNPD